jgi:hypothetical protein
MPGAITGSATEPTAEPPSLGGVSRGQKQLTDRRLRPDRRRPHRGADVTGRLDRLAGEGAFVACTFWLAECLAHQGRLAQAQTWFSRAAATATTLACSPSRSTLTAARCSTTPAGLSHLAHLTAAVALQREAATDPELTGARHGPGQARRLASTESPPAKAHHDSTGRLRLSSLACRPGGTVVPRAATQASTRQVHLRVMPSQGIVSTGTWVSG